MNFDLPSPLVDYLKELDDFIEREIRPLEQQDDNINNRRQEAVRQRQEIQNEMSQAEQEMGSLNDTSETDEPSNRADLRATNSPSP